MRALAGICTNGTISKMLATRMKQNTVVRKGAQGSPSGPIVWRITPLWMKSMTDSAAFCTPVGTRLPCLPATQKNRKVRAAASHMTRTTLFTASGVPDRKNDFHSTSRLRGGNSRASVTQNPLLAGLTPGKAREAETWRASSTSRPRWVTARVRTSGTIATHDRPSTANSTAVSRPSRTM